MDGVVLYPWGDSRRFNSYSGYFRCLFGGRVQKVTVNAGFTCPNRDGTIGTGGCTFCSNDAFTPSYCMSGGDVRWQIEEGMRFHRNRYRRADRYLVYFQSFSNTYGPLDRLRELYDTALSVPDVAGIIVGTRPDCVDDQKLDYFARLARDRYVAIEYGVESCYNETLRRVNRGHDFATAAATIRATAERGVYTGAHFILGLPGESDKMIIDQTALINELPLTTIKFHQLQIFHGTAMARQYAYDPGAFSFREAGEYVAFFAEILRRLRPDLVVERFASEAPPRHHAGPNWYPLRNDQLLTMLEKYLEDNNFYQGELFFG